MENGKFESKSSMDKGTRIKTGFVFLLFASIAGLFFLISIKQPQLIVVAIILLLIYIVALIYGIYKTPILYKITNGDLLILSRFSKISIKIQDIRSARIFDSEDKKGLVRTFGAEGVLGNIGNYSTIRHKKINVLTSRDTNWILISTYDGKKTVISPDNLDLVNVVNDLINKDK
jgi:hypothetical protein